MAAIPLKLSQFVYADATPVSLATAPWISNIDYIYELNPTADGWISYTPGLAFNALTQLVKDGFYLVSCHTTFDLPFAQVTAGDGAGAAGLITPAINFTQPADMHVGDADQLLIATSNSPAPIVFDTDDHSKAVVIDGKLRAVEVGSFNVIATQVGSGGYGVGTSFKACNVLIIAVPTPLVKVSFTGFYGGKYEFASPGAPSGTNYGLTLNGVDLGIQTSPYYDKSQTGGTVVNISVIASAPNFSSSAPAIATYNTKATPTRADLTAAPAITDFHYNVQSTKINEFSEIKFYTDATSGTVTIYNDLFADYPQYCSIQMLANGNYVAEFIPSANNVSDTFPFSGLIAGFKTISFRTGAQVGSKGTYITSLTLTNQVGVLLEPDNGDDAIAAIVDSIMSGVGTSDPTSKATPMLLRDDSTFKQSIALMGYGGATAAEALSINKISTITDVVNYFADKRSKTLLLQRSINDYRTGSTTPLALAYIYSTFIDDLHAADSTIKIVISTPIWSQASIFHDGAGNGLEAYRIALANVATGRSWVSVIDGKELCPQTSFASDDLHPNDAGNVAMAAVYKIFLTTGAMPSTTGRVFKYGYNVSVVNNDVTQIGGAFSPPSGSQIGAAFNFPGVTLANNVVNWVEFNLSTDLTKDIAVVMLIDNENDGNYYYPNCSTRAAMFYFSDGYLYVDAKTGVSNQQLTAVTPVSGMRIRLLISGNDIKAQTSTDGINYFDHYTYAGAATTTGTDALIAKIAFTASNNPNAFEALKVTQG
jgi:hypothetical protein